MLGFLLISFVCFFFLDQGLQELDELCSIMKNDFMSGNFIVVLFYYVVSLLFFNIIFAIFDDFYCILLKFSIAFFMNYLKEDMLWQKLDWMKNICAAKNRRREFEVIYMLMQSIFWIFIFRCLRLTIRSWFKVIFCRIEESSR